jgi:hypothetical protein
MNDSNKEFLVKALQIEQSLARLAGQKTSTLRLTITSKVRARPGKRSMERVPVEEIVTVNIHDLSHVSVNTIKQSGDDCVRLVFGEELYATSGKKASEAIEWAQKTASGGVTEEVKPFPRIAFEQVVGQVKIMNGEMMFA